MRACRSGEFEYQNHSVMRKDVTLQTVVSNGLFARRNQGDINHVEGDIHYVVPFLDRQRTILTVHDCRHLDQGLLQGLRKHIYQLLWFDIPCTFARRVVTISQASKRRLLQHLNLDPGEITVIPNCVPRGYTPAPKEFNCDAPRVLHVGTKANKNLFRVAKALRGITCHLRIIGRLHQNQKDMLRRNAIDYSNTFSISDQEMLREYKECDIVMFPSLYEGFGMPILEGQAIGRPVITSDAPPMSEVARKGAVLVDPEDPKSIRAAVAKLIARPSFRRQIVKQGIKNSERYSAHRIAKMYEEVYHEVLAANSC